MDPGKDRLEALDESLRPLVTHRWTIPVLLLLAAGMAISAFDTKLALSGDNAEFILLGRAIAEGHGLAYTHSPDPRPATKYPFGFPLLLAGVHLLAPGEVQPMKMLVALHYVASIPLLLLLLRRVSPPSLTLPVVAAAILSEPVLGFSSQVMSEVPFLPYSLLGLLCLLRAAERGTTGNLIAAVLAVMAAYYVRSIGIALVVAGIAFLLGRRRVREAAIFGGGCVLLAFPWYLRTALLGGKSYLNTWLLADPYRPQAGSLTFAGLVDRVVQNLQVYSWKVIPQSIFPSWFADHQLFVAMGTLVSLFVLVYVARQALRGELIALYMFIYLGACMLWPSVWSDIRLTLPLTPFFVLAGLTTLYQAWGFASNRKPLFLRTAVPALALLLVLASNAEAMERRLARPDRYPPEWDNYFKAAEWIADNTPSDAVICCRKGFLMSLLSRRKAIAYPFTQDTEALIKAIEDRGATHIAVDRFTWTNSTARYLIPAVNAHSSRFEVMKKIPNPDTYVLKFD